MFHVKQMFSSRKTKSLTEPKWLKMADHGHHDRGVCPGILFQMYAEPKHQGRDVHDQHFTDC